MKTQHWYDSALQHTHCAFLAIAPSKGLASCAANTASNHSIAGGLHALGIGNNGGIGGFLTNTFGGNTYSGISNLISTLGSSRSTDQQVLNQTGKAYLRGPLQGIPSSLVGAGGTPFASSPTGLVRGAAVGAASNAVTGANESLVTLSGEVGLSTVGTTAAEFATGVGEAKFALDTVTYLEAVGTLYLFRFFAELRCLLSMEGCRRLRFRGIRRM